MKSFTICTYNQNNEVEDEEIGGAGSTNGGEEEHV
jgi:hypothetical protein